MSVGLTLLLTVGVYALTFPIAWMLLARLVARSASRRTMWRDPRFWVTFILYRLVIFAPYGVLLVLGQWLPSYFIKVVWGWVILTLGLSVVRFAGTDRIVNLLWWLYGYCYDGLRGFYPYRQLVTLTVEAAKAEGELRVLDLGCGTGNVIERLVRDDPRVEVVGVDRSASMLGRARKKLRGSIGDGRVSLTQADIMTFLHQLPAASYDRVIMVNVLYAVADREEVWRECLRLIKPKGIIVATTSDRGGSWPIIRDHLRHDHWWRLLGVRLLCTGIIDYFINEFARADIFQFPSEKTLVDEARKAGGYPGPVTRCYGGVNVLFTVGKTRPGS